MDMDYKTDHVSLASPPNSYELSGKIMLTSIVILLVVVVFIVVLHLYGRWYLHRMRRRYLLRRRHPTQIVFHVDPNNPNSSTLGLDASVLTSLPIFVYSSLTYADVLECAVCLSEFEDNEKGRLLPKCHHSFHLDCIDMWFHSHSTCPLCRSPVESEDPGQVPENNGSDMVLSVSDLVETGSGSGSGFICQNEEERIGSTSLAGRRKGLNLVGVRIEVPRRTESEDELPLSSPAGQVFKSPGSRLMSLKRILSMNRKTVAVSPSSGIGTSCESVGTDLDIELGRDELTQRRTQTPKERVVSVLDIELGSDELTQGLAQTPR